MWRIFFSIFIFGMLLVGSASVWAQQEEIYNDPALAYRQSFLANPRYNEMARDLLKTKSPYFDFMEFRSVYARTRQYDPMGDKTIGQMNDLAYLVMNQEDPERAQGALFAYQTLVSNHLAHIDVVMLALSLARQDKRFGKPEFFDWVKEGIINTVVISGDGLSLSGAYDVITLSEETVLFHRLGLKPYKTQSAKEGIVYYNMHDAIDVGTGEKRPVFVDTRIPMKYLAAVKEIEDREFTLDLRRQ